MANTKALVVISFGSTFAETRIHDIGGIEQALAEKFPDYDQYRAFTSAIVRKRLLEQGISVNSVEEILERLKEKGYEEILLQPTHLLHGEEFEHKILGLQKKYSSFFKNMTIGKPLICDDEDYKLVAEALGTCFPKLQENEGIVLMGHGSPRPNNKSFRYTYPKLQEIFDTMQLPVLVGTVEDEDAPNLDSVLKSLQKRGYTKVHMYPLMVVAGDHANNDMYGDDPESWKTQIESLGITTEGHLNGIGRYKAIQNLYIRHIVQVLSTTQGH